MNPLLPDMTALGASATWHDEAPMAMRYPCDGLCRGRGQERYNDPDMVQLARRAYLRLGGLWRVSDEWGPVYSGAMTDENEAVAPVHDRMPVLLHRDEYDRWLNGSFDDLLAFQQRVFPSDGIEIDRTPELWVRKKGAAAEAHSSHLL